MSKPRKGVSEKMKGNSGNKCTSVKLKAAVTGRIISLRYRTC